MMNTPIAFFIFKRPDTTQKVLEEIWKAKPSKLLVIADGPRQDKSDELEKCAITRTLVDSIDWQCDVLKNYSDTNLGCARRVASGLDWVFSLVDRAIILEDDCLPHPSFFPYCEALLDKYYSDSRIMSITGQNVQLGRSVTPHSYFFSRYFHCWGWASWRRAWQYYSLEMEDLPKVKNQVLDATFHNIRARKYWGRVLQGQYEGEYATWDYSANFSFWAQSGLHIHPSRNLISNLGFGAGATNTTGISAYANLETFEMKFPLNHPSFVLPNTDADEFTQTTHYDPDLIYRIKRKLFLRTLRNSEC